MNGVHDMGGMAGFGDIDPRPDVTLFHEPWEGRALALTLAAGALGMWNIDRSRLFRELIPGPDYLRISYYERWFAALTALLIDHGLVTAAEAQSGMAVPSASTAAPPPTAPQMERILARGGPTLRPSISEPRFVLGQRVRARNLNPVGHIRMPRYVRGHPGEITRLHGSHVFPDTHAHGLGEQPRPLYQVRFEARDLWGPGAYGPGAVYVDLWEPYLEPL